MQRKKDIGRIRIFKSHRDPVKSITYRRLCSDNNMSNMKNTISTTINNILTALDLIIQSFITCVHQYFHILNDVSALYFLPLACFDGCSYI